MKQTLTTNEIARLLVADTDGGWSYNGARALAEYLEECEEASGEEMEFDSVALRCEYSEHESLQEWAEGYFGSREKYLTELGLEPDEDDGEETDSVTIDEFIADYIQDNGQLIEFDGGIIVSSF